MEKKKAWAQCTLGNKYYNGEYGIKKDVERAFVLFTLAAEQGDANAQYNLGQMYRNGDLPEHDRKTKIPISKATKQ